MNDPLICETASYAVQSTVVLAIVFGHWALARPTVFVKELDDSLGLDLTKNIAEPIPFNVMGAMFTPWRVNVVFIFRSMLTRPAGITIHLA